jgi:putative transposase
MSKRDRRVAARTKATTPPADKQAHRDEQTHSVASAEPAPEPEDGDTPLAKVIPLGIFDPFAEADKRW